MINPQINLGQAGVICHYFVIDKSHLLAISDRRIYAFRNELMRLFGYEEFLEYYISSHGSKAIEIEIKKRLNNQSS